MKKMNRCCLEELLHSKGNQMRNQSTHMMTVAWIGSMLPLVPRSDSFTDSNDDSADNSSSEGSDPPDDDGSGGVNESIYSATRAVVIKNIEEINMKARKQGCIQMETSLYPHTNQDLLCSIQKPISIGGIDSEGNALMIEYRRTFGGIVRTKIKILQEKAPAGVYTLHPFFRRIACGDLS